jgi:serine/threonine protein kinase
MRPDRWRTIEELYQSAADLPDAERDSFLQQECGHDDTLLLEVKSLLKHSSSSQNLLDGSAIAILAEDFAVDESQAGGVFAPGKTISHYRILETIGRGGMSVVYKAGDLKLGRPVALKFLPSYLSQDPQSLLRFEREARAASALNHPNICTVYEIDQYEGSHFISMEWLQGESLDARMARGRLQIPEILGIATDVSHALEVAHSAGIIHRDVKPANIFLTQTGAAKVLDFGEAKRLSKEPDDLDRPPSVPSIVGRDLTLTLPGAPLGTAGYMSPEQAAGLRVDPRSDIFSMGVVLYQMTTGKLPFDGKSPADLIRGVQSEAHTPISELDPKAPPALSRIIHKALQKDPSLRYENAAEMRADLQELRRHLEKNGNGRRAILVPAIVLSLLAVAATAVVRVPRVHEWTARKSSATASNETKSLAVLPFANLTGSPAQEYFVDGMTDALTTNLAQIKSLRVTSLSSVMGYKDIHKTPSEIAKELKVDTLVEGSVVRSGDSVRIDVQLTRARDGHNVWARTYNRHVNNVLTLQNEVARAVASEIQVELTPQEQSRFAMAQTVDPEAYQLYLRGRYCWNKRTDDGYNKAIEFFQRALAIQPDYPQAYAGLADSYAMLGT